MIEQIGISDHTNERRYYSTVPNIVFDLSDTPYDPAIYRAMLYCAGGQGKTCFASVRRIAEIAKVSMGQVHKSQQSLAKNKFIEFTGKLKVSQAGQAINHWILLDLWPRNMRYYEERSPGEHFKEPDLEQERSRGERKRSPGETEKGTLRKEEKTEAKDTDTNVSEQAPKLPPTNPTPKAPANEGASASENDEISPPAEGTGADPPAKKTAPKTLGGFKETLCADPPKDRGEYARACSGLVRRMTGYAYLRDVHQVDLIPLITKVIFKGLNGTGPPSQVQVERLYRALMMAKDTLTPDKDAADVWPWMMRRVEAIMLSECVSVPPFDFRWTHKAPDGITWREKLCPKII